MSKFPRAYRQPGACFLVAEAPSGALVGMAGLLDGEIRRVFVEPAWRDRGLGKRLVLTLVGEQARQERLPPAGRLRAVVGRGNGASRRLFEACGFAPAGAVLRYRSMGHHDLFERLVTHDRGFQVVRQLGPGN